MNRKRTVSYGCEYPDDAELRDRAYRHGLRRTARAMGITAGFLQKFFIGHARMDADKVAALLKEINCV